MRMRWHISSADAAHVKTGSSASNELPRCDSLSIVLLSHNRKYLTINASAAVVTAAAVETGTPAGRHLTSNALWYWCSCAVARTCPCRCYQMTTWASLPWTMACLKCVFS
jgi:hypothetical protein